LIYAKHEKKLRYCFFQSGEIPMSAFIIVDTKIANELEYEEYKKLAKPIAEKYGGIYRVRGGRMDVRETNLWRPTRMVVVEFPDMASAQTFLDSEEYAPVKQLRHKHAECTLFIVDGS
jgi:uncharacterized protein (DUF1330 family)